MNLKEIKLSKVFVTDKKYEYGVTKITLDATSDFKKIDIDHDSTCVLVNHDLNIVDIGGYLAAYKPTQKNEIKFTNAFENIYDKNKYINTLVFYGILFLTLVTSVFFDCFIAFVIASIVINAILFYLEIDPKSDMVEFKGLYRFYKMFVFLGNLFFSISALVAFFYFYNDVEIKKYFYSFFYIIEICLLGGLTYFDMLNSEKTIKFYNSAKEKINELLK